MPIVTARADTFGLSGHETVEQLENNMDFYGLHPGYIGSRRARQCMLIAVQLLRILVLRFRQPRTVQ